MFIDFLVDVFKENSGKKSIIWKGQVYSYSVLLEKIDVFRKTIEQSEVIPGAVVALKGDF